MTYSFCPNCGNPLMGSDGVDYDCLNCGFRQPVAPQEEDAAPSDSVEEGE